MERYELAAAEFELLRLALVALDRADDAAATIAKDGPVIPDRWGGLKQHPAVDVENRSRYAFAGLVRQLNVVLGRGSSRVGAAWGEAWPEGSDGAAEERLIVARLRSELDRVPEGMEMIDVLRAYTDLRVMVGQLEVAGWRWPSKAELRELSVAEAVEVVTAACYAYGFRFPPRVRGTSTRRYLGGPD